RPAVEHLSRGRPVAVRSADQDLSAPRTDLERGRQLSRRGPRLVERHGPRRDHRRTGPSAAASPASDHERRPAPCRRYHSSFCHRLTMSSLAQSATLNNGFQMEKVIEFSPQALKAPFFLRIAAMCIDYMLVMAVPIVWLLSSKFFGDGANATLSNTVWLFVVII